MAAAKGDLIELGVQFVEAILYPKVDIVERAFDEGIARIDGRGGDIRLGNAAGSARPWSPRCRRCRR